MTSPEPATSPRAVPISRRKKGHRSGVGRWLDRRYIRTRKHLRRWLFPLYRRLGLKSVVAWFVPGYRQVSKSKGGLALQGNLLGQPKPHPVIAIIGDYGSGKVPSHQVAELVAQRGANAVVTLGDNVYYETGFQTLVGNLYGDYIHAGAFFPATGNHDYSEGRGIALFDRYFDFLQGHRWYSVRLGEVEFFLLDSTQALHHEDVFHAQRAWLETAAGKSTAVWKVVVTHHPPHSARSRSQAEFRFPYQQWGVQLVMSGHDHTLQHLHFDGVDYVVNGIGGGSLHYFDEILEGTVFRHEDEYGAVFLEVAPNALQVRFVTIPSGEVHHFEIPRPH